MFAIPEIIPSGPSLVEEWDMVLSRPRSGKRTCRWAGAMHLGGRAVLPPNFPDTPLRPGGSFWEGLREERVARPRIFPGLFLPS